MTELKRIPSSSLWGMSPPAEWFPVVCLPLSSWWKETFLQQLSHTQRDSHKLHKHHTYLKHTHTQALTYHHFNPLIKTSTFSTHKHGGQSYDAETWCKVGTWATAMLTQSIVHPEAYTHGLRCNWLRLSEINTVQQP